MKECDSVGPLSLQTLLFVKTCYYLATFLAVLSRKFISEFSLDEKQLIAFTEPCLVAVCSAKYSQFKKWLKDRWRITILMPPAIESRNCPKVASVRVYTLVTFTLLTTWFHVQFIAIYRAIIAGFPM